MSWISKNLWLVAVIASLSIVVIAGFCILCVALKYSPDLIESNPYEKGLDFQKELDSENRFKQLGWKAIFELKREADQVLVEVQLTDRFSSPISGATVNLNAKRPSNSALDRSELLIENKQSLGRYQLTDKLIDGLWIFQLFIKKDSEEITYQEKVIIP